MSASALIIPAFPVISFDLQKALESKRAYRKKLVALPIAEKLRILEQLSERATVIQRSRLAKGGSAK